MVDLRYRLPAHALITRALEDSPGLAPGSTRSPWYLGALGEITVAGVLADLPDEWTVIHSIPVGSRQQDIDHLVVGPPGAFVLNTKTHMDKSVWIAGRGLLVNGQRTAYIAKSAREADLASARLSLVASLEVEVTPVLVFVGSARISRRAHADGGAQILEESGLLAYLTSLPRRYSEEQVHRIATAASLSQTWSASFGSEQVDRAASIRFTALLARDAVAHPARPESTQREVRASAARTHPRRPRARRTSARSSIVGAFAAVVVGIGAFGLFSAIASTLVAQLIAR